ncbi:hypothetical protein [Streptomyces sp. NPDC007988]|uniref:hypothetical protein n=1 Tax=Streptomyces sp. NPDC007988 TaxID=3364802 RepID=UPI0036E5ED3A
MAVPRHDAARLRLEVAPGLLPPGGRRAGFLAQVFRPQRVRLGMRTLTGRLTVTDEDSRYAPHTSTDLAAPPYKTFLTASKRLLAQYELRRTRRDGTAARPQALAAHSPMD